MPRTYWGVQRITLSPFLPEGRGQSAHRKEGNHAKLNNAMLQSPHYDLVSGWLYKHSDTFGLFLTAQSAGL